MASTGTGPGTKTTGAGGKKATSRLDRLFHLVQTGSTSTIKSTAAKQLGQLIVSSVSNHAQVSSDLAFTFYPHLSRLMDLLRQDAWDTRVAAGAGLEYIAKNIPPFLNSSEANDQTDTESIAHTASSSSSSIDIPSAQHDLLNFEHFDLNIVLSKGRHLLASLGVEFDIPSDVSDPKARLALMKKTLKQQLGMGSEFIEDVLDVSEADINQNTPSTDNVPNNAEDVKELAGLSARERNKRKRQAKAAAQNPRKHGRNDMALSTDSSASHAPSTMDHQVASIIVSKREWVFEGFVEVLSLDLFDPIWYVRHGAAIGLKSILQHQGSALATLATMSAPENRQRRDLALQDLSIRCICVLALDRFVDFISDSAVVPVREMVGQILGCISSHCSLGLACSIISRGIYTLASKSPSATSGASQVGDSWSGTFSALIGLKYILVARKGDLSKEFASLLPPRMMEVIFSCLSHSNDDVRRAAASSILHVVDYLDRRALLKLLPVIWLCLRDVDELSSWTVPVMELLSALMGHLRSDSGGQVSHFQVAEDQWRLLFPLLRHPILSVRIQVVQTLELKYSLGSASSQSSNFTSAFDEECRFLALQNMILDAEHEVILASSKLFASIISISSDDDTVFTFISNALALIMHPLGTRFPESSFRSDLISHLDKAMIQQDVLILSEDVRMFGRLAASKALGLYLTNLAKYSRVPARLLELLTPYSYSWVCQICCLCFALAPVVNMLPDAVPHLLAQIPDVDLFFCELLNPLTRVHQECMALSHTWGLAAEHPLPPLPAQGSLSQTSFSIQSARDFSTYVKASTASADVAVTLHNAISAYEGLAIEYQTRARAACAYLITQKAVWPEKLTPIVRSLMNSLRTETNQELQKHSAQGLALLCTRNSKKRGMVDKIFGNVLKTIDGSVPVLECVGGVAFRGFDAFLKHLSELNDDGLLVEFPQVEVYASSIQEAAAKVADASAISAEVISALQLLYAFIPYFPESALPLCLQLLSPVYLLAQYTSKTYSPWMSAYFAAMASRSGTRQAVLLVLVERLFPDLENIANWRVGIAEIVSSVVKKLSMDILPYIALFTLPLLPRMSDPTPEVREICTELFSSLVVLIPLENGLPDPQDMHPTLVRLRKEKSKFLGQLIGNVPIDPYPINLPIQAELRPYQREGVSWLLWLNSYGLHGLLADDMGLGKTLQTICVLAIQHRPDVKHPTQPSPGIKASLIICPATLVAHWIHEINHYASFLQPVAYVGDKYFRSKILKQLDRYDVIVTSYDLARNDIDELAAHTFHYCVLDEGHLIKGRKSKTTQAIKCIRSQHRLLLTGTPIQNNVLELWSLFDFLMPGFLGKEEQFSDSYSKAIMASREKNVKLQEQGNLALEALHKQTLPFILRRCKEDVLKDLPPKIIQDYYCELSPLQKKMLAAYMKQNNILGEEKEHIFKTLQYLRKLINHPALVFNPEHPGYKEIVAELKLTGGIASIDKDPKHAPKLMALQQLLSDIGLGINASDDDVDAVSSLPHRVLIFSQTTEMLNRVQDSVLNPLQISSLRLDGTVEAAKRHGIVTLFNADPSIDVLLLTTSVGGLGLNLTGADTVIFIDHDWNPMKDLQAMDRAHRLGQKRVVQVYRLITKDTLEEKIMGLQKFKLNIATSVVNVDNTGILSMNTGAIIDLLHEEVGGKTSGPSTSSSGKVTLGKMLEEIEARAAAGEEDVEDLGIQEFLQNFLYVNNAIIQFTAAQATIPIGLVLRVSELQSWNGTTWVDSSSVISNALSSAIDFHNANKTYFNASSPITLVPRLTQNNSDDIIAVTDLIEAYNVSGLITASMYSSDSQAQVSTAYKIPHCILKSKSSELDDRTAFPYIIRMDTWESTSGRVGLDFAMENAWTNIGVLYEQTEYCSQWYLDLVTRNQLQYNGSVNLVMEMSYTGSASLSNALKSVSASNVRVILSCSDSAPSVQRLLTTLYSTGLLTNGLQWIFNAFPYNQYATFPDPPNNPFPYSALAGQFFISNVMSPSPSNLLDFIWRSRNITKYPLTSYEAAFGSGALPFSAFVLYDCLSTLLTGFSQGSSSGLFSKTSILQRTIFNSTMVTNSSAFIIQNSTGSSQMRLLFDETMTLISAKGIKNFPQELVKSGKISTYPNAYIWLPSINAESGAASVSRNSSVILLYADGALVPVRVQSVYARIHISQAAIVVILSFLVIYSILTLLLLAYVAFNRHAKHIMRAAPVFLILITVGSISNYASILLKTLSPTLYICTAMIWTKHIGFVIAFGSLVLKSYRIAAIFNADSSRVVVITNTGLIIMLGSGLVSVVLYLLIWSFLAPLNPQTFTLQVNSIPDYQEWSTCPASNMEQYLLIGELIFALYGAYIAFKTRNVPSEYNESVFLGSAIYTWVIVEVLFYIGWLYTRKIIDIAYVVSCFSIFLTIGPMLGLVYMPKIMISMGYAPQQLISMDSEAVSSNPYQDQQSSFIPSPDTADSSFIGTNGPAIGEGLSAVSAKPTLPINTHNVMTTTIGAQSAMKISDFRERVRHGKGMTLSDVEVDRIVEQMTRLRNTISTFLKNGAQRRP